MAESIGSEHGAAREETTHESRAVRKIHRRSNVLLVVLTCAGLTSLPFAKLTGL
jgi:hypothetical protein